MVEDDALGRYRDLRDFRRSPEPDGDGSDGRSAWSEDDDNPVFVIQEHRASSHHFDLRLEIDGVLKSWAVPKGPSTDPSERRLAVAVEDHPLEYATFEGTIPEGEYGAGTVLVWDAGPYRAIPKEDGTTPSLERQHRDGRIEVWLHGRKIRGGHALIHTRTGGDDRHWLLIKMDDDGADARRNPTSTEPRSVLSGRTLDEIASEEGD